jgi:transposase
MNQSWSEGEWLPDERTLTLIGVTAMSRGVVVEADGPVSARCPACRRSSRSRHSRYWRTLKDLPAQGQAVTLRVRVTRWRCRNGRCESVIFADRLPTISPPRVQRTNRLGAVVHLVGHALGGRGGERLLSRLAMAVSDDTILRLLKQPVPAPLAPETLHVVGIDDWAWQKGQHHFGTIFVDLERRQVVDVLAVRTADAVAAWLAAHPGITTISRDRYGPYAEGVRRGAPQATQVADRFHLVFNLRGAVEQELRRLRDCLIVPCRPRTAAEPSPAARVVARPRRQRSAVVAHEHRVQERRTRQLTRFQRVKQLQAAGHTGCAIMRDTGIGRGSVYKWMRLNELPPRQQMDPRHGMPAFYRVYLRQRWAAGQQSGRRLMAEIKTRGYVGGYSGLAKLLAPWREAVPGRRDPPPLAHPATVDSGTPMAVAVRHVSPRIAAALLGQPPPLLNERRAQTVDALKAQCPGFTTMRRLVLSFGTILRVGKVATLHRWLTRAHATNIHPLQRFVRTLRQDLGAVNAAVTEPWSNGPVEGHINRLKTLRRQMYGRAGVDLLRARLLPLRPLAPR